jgi:hypothetical protein
MQIRIPNPALWLSVVPDLDHSHVFMSKPMVANLIRIRMGLHCILLSRYLGIRIHVLKLIFNFGIKQFDLFKFCF